MSDHPHSYRYGRHDPFEIHITSHGQYIGKMSPEEFRAGAKAPKTMFLAEVIKDYNAWKASIGEPERAELVITSPRKKQRKGKR